ARALRRDELHDEVRHEPTARLRVRVPRQPALDARGFFPAAKALRIQNEWGFTLGGPVVVPKVYNGRNKTFWLFSLDQFYIRGGQLAGLNTNATARMVAGDFGELSVPIADPRSTTISSSGVASRTAFPGNLIPKTAFASVTSKMLQYYPAAELTGLTGNSIAP